MSRHDLLGDLWLPTGAHWDLNIKRGTNHENSGAFIDAGWKMIWHTTESSRDTADIIEDVLRNKRAAPHFVFGYNPDTRFPVVIQLLPLNVAGRALAHTLPPETNRARCIQCEICGFAAHSGHWSDNYYRGLANLGRMIERRVAIPRRAPVSFKSPRRLSPGGFVNARGHYGHSMVPGNDHTDPGTGFKVGRLFDLMDRCGSHGLELKPVSR